MADEKVAIPAKGPDEIEVVIRLNQKNGKFGVFTDCPSQVTQLGMISMAEGLLQKPKESSIIKAAAGMFSKKA